MLSTAPGLTIILRIKFESEENDPPYHTPIKIMNSNYSCHLLYLLLKNVPNIVGRIIGWFMNFLFPLQTSAYNCLLTLMRGHPWFNKWYVFEHHLGVS